MVKKPPKATNTNENRFGTELIFFATEWWLSDDKGKKLAAALIFANYSEYIALLLLDRIELEIDKKLIYSTLSIIRDNNKRPSNLESTILRLESYKFPDREKIIPLLKKIKDNRNKLFHQLLISNEQAIRSKVTNIVNDVQKLEKMHFVIQKMIKTEFLFKESKT